MDLVSQVDVRPFVVLYSISFVVVYMSTYSLSLSF